MKTVWLLIDVTQTPKMYFSGFHNGCVVSDVNPFVAQKYESEQHANSNLTFAMKHMGFVAKPVALPFKRYRTSRRR